MTQLLVGFSAGIIRDSCEELPTSVNRCRSLCKCSSLNCIKVSFAGIMKRAKKRPSCSASSFHGMRKDELRACANTFGVRTRRSSASGVSNCWRKNADMIVDCEKAARRTGQSTLKSLFNTKCPGRQATTIEDSARPQTSALFSALRNITDISSFRREAKALNLKVRLPKSDGHGRRWRTKDEILADYAGKLGHSLVGSPSGASKEPGVVLPIASHS